MTTYTIALFVHLIGVVVIFIALGIGQRAGARMRGARSIEHVRLWLGLLKVTTPMFPTALVLLLGSGLFMTADSWSFTTPWVGVSIGAVLTVGAVGAGLAIRGFGRMETAVEAALEMTDEIRSVLDDPSTWAALFAVNGMSLAVLWLMVVKPGWMQSLVLPTAFSVVGVVLGSMTARRRLWSVADAETESR
jgi:hypothetical protein